MEEKGYSLNLQAQKTKSVADTMNITDPVLRQETIKTVNKVGKHLINNIRSPKHLAKDNMANYLHALVAVSPPKVQDKDSAQFEF